MIQFNRVSKRNTQRHILSYIWRVHTDVYALRRDETRRFVSCVGVRGHVFACFQSAAVFQLNLRTPTDATKLDNTKHV